MGNDCVISYHSTVITGTDQPSARYMNDARSTDERNVIRGKIVLGERVFIGANSVIAISEKHPTIKIADGVVVGSGAYIGRSITEKDIVKRPETVWREYPRRYKNG